MIHMYFIKNSCSDEKVHKYLSTYFHMRGICSQVKIIVISVEVLESLGESPTRGTFSVFFPYLPGITFEMFCFDNLV